LTIWSRANVDALDAFLKNDPPIDVEEEEEDDDEEEDEEGA
jgi:hypothetical protein